jgi:hypothetical protein
MAKITQSGALVDPFTLPRPELITETRTFTDDSAPGVEIEVTLQSSGDFTLPMAVNTTAREYIRTYGAKNAIPIMVGGRKVDVTDELCYFVALLTALETEPSSFEFWAATSVTMRYAMAEIAVWAEALINREPQPAAAVAADGSKVVPIPNESAATTEPTSELPQPTGEPIPNS